MTRLPDRPGRHRRRHSPDTGGTYSAEPISGESAVAEIDGSNHLYNSTAGSSIQVYGNSATASTTEFDVSANLIVHDTTTLTAPSIWADLVGSETTINGYQLQLFNNGGSPVWYSIVWNAGASTVVYNGDSPAISTGTYACTVATRNINSEQYVFFIANGALVGSTVQQDGTLTSKLAGIGVQTQAGSTQTGSTGVTVADLYGRNVDWSAASSLGLSGPSSGYTGIASTNFTVAATTLSGSDTVTPHSDSGGTFSPTSLSFGSGSSSLTFTYTPAANGVHEISITDTLGATISGSPVAYTSSASPLVVTFPSADIYQNPYCWRNSGGAAICPVSGGYLKFTVTGTTQITANVNTTLNSTLDSADMPTIKVLVNSPAADGAYTFAQFPANNTASTPVTLATGLSTGTTYSVVLSIISGNPSDGNGWTGTVPQTQINSLQFDAAATVAQPSNLRSKNALFLGASYEAGNFGGEETGTYYSWADFTLSWPFFAAWALGCEYGQVGVGSQGWVNTGIGGYPAFPSSWNAYDSTHAKTFNPAPDYVFVHQAENDNGQSSGAVTSAVTAWITAARTAFGSRPRSSSPSVCRRSSQRRFSPVSPPRGTRRRTS